MCGWGWVWRRVAQSTVLPSCRSPFVPFFLRVPSCAKRAHHKFRVWDSMPHAQALRSRFPRCVSPKHLTFSGKCTRWMRGVGWEGGRLDGWTVDGWTVDGWRFVFSTMPSERGFDPNFAIRPESAPGWKMGLEVGSSLSLSVLPLSRTSLDRFRFRAAHSQRTIGRTLHPNCDNEFCHSLRP